MGQECHNFPVARGVLTVRKITLEAVKDYLLAHAYASTREIAIDLDVSESTVRRYLRELDKTGLLHKQPYYLSQFGYTWLYFLRDPYSL
jgi:predicted transcriptional regulator